MSQGPPPRLLPNYPGGTRAAQRARCAGQSGGCAGCRGTEGGRPWNVDRDARPGTGGAQLTSATGWLPSQLAVLLDRSDPAPRFLDRLEQLVKGFSNEQHILKPIDLEVLVEYGVERKGAAIALGSEGVRGVAVR